MVNPADILVFKSGNKQFESEGVPWAEYDAYLGDQKVSVMATGPESARRDTVERFNLTVVDLPLLEQIVCETPENSEKNVNNTTFAEGGIPEDPITKKNISDVISGKSKVSEGGAIQADGKQNNKRRTHRAFQ